MSNHATSLSAQPSARLNPVSCLVLGLIGLRGPSTPYDLKRAISLNASLGQPEQLRLQFVNLERAA